MSLTPVPFVIKRLQPRTLYGVAVLCAFACGHMMPPGQPPACRLALRLFAVSSFESPLLIGGFPPGEALPPRPVILPGQRIKYAVSC